MVGRWSVAGVRGEAGDAYVGVGRFEEKYCGENCGAGDARPMKKDGSERSDHL